MTQDNTYQTAHGAILALNLTDGACAVIETPAAQKGGKSAQVLHNFTIPDFAYDFVREEIEKSMRAVNQGIYAEQAGMDSQKEKTKIRQRAKKHYESAQKSLDTLNRQHILYKQELMRAKPLVIGGEK